MKSEISDMTQFIKNFFRREDGAVTVDWVVLTAATVGLAGGLGVTMTDGITTASTTVSTAVGTKTVDNGN